MSTPPPILNGFARLWIVLSHLSILLGVGIVLPLVIYLVTGDKTGPVGYHSREALNFHISIYLYTLLCVPCAFLCFIGIPMIVVIWIAVFILSIIAAAKSSDGSHYQYPLTIRFVR